ncbi:MAG: hypothetical protein KAV82_15945 [Phycisphaerae bacterium]|nr:hypothetical protein [Phycisphaerae bacterium]
MQATTNSRGRRHVWRLIRKHLPPTGLGAGGLLLAGCATMAGVGALLAFGLLWGTFLGRIQASMAATANSYGYADAGSVQWGFGQSHNSNVQLNTFGGRLPGFHCVCFVTPNGKTIPHLQTQEPVFYATDVEINFETNPPTLSGTISEIDGDQQFSLSEIYPELGPVSLSISSNPETGKYDIRITIHARGAEGEELDYSLIWHAQLSTSGLTLEGNVDIERVLTTADGEEIIIEGTGSLTTAADDRE